MRNNSLSRNALLILAVTTFAANPLAVQANEAHHGVNVQAKVHAPIKVTYEALRNLLVEDPDGTKILSSNEHECVVEEIFDKLPVIGQAVCVYKETYDAPNKVAFKMIRSDKLKAFEGEWTLTEIENGKATLVKLHSYVDTGLKIPFAKQMTQMASSGEVKQHLEVLKKQAELKEKKLAAGRAQNSL